MYFSAPNTQKEVGKVDSFDRLLQNKNRAITRVKIGAVQASEGCKLPIAPESPRERRLSSVTQWKTSLQ